MEKKSQHFKGGGVKMGVFMQLFFKIIYISELISYKLHIYVKIILIILSITYLNLLRLSIHLMCKKQKSWVHFSKFKTWVYLNVK